MKRREFNRVLRSVTTRATRNRPARVDLDKVRALSDETKVDMVLFLVRERAPLLLQLMAPGIDRSWLQACGYLYPYRSNGFAFLGLQQHQLEAADREKERARQEAERLKIPIAWPEAV